MADLLHVAVNNIQLQVSAGSVLVTATIIMTNVTSGDAAVHLLQTTSVSSLGASLNVAVQSVQDVSLNVIAFEAPLPAASLSTTALPAASLSTTAHPHPSPSTTALPTSPSPPPYMCTLDFMQPSSNNVLLPELDPMAILPWNSCLWKSYTLTSIANNNHKAYTCGAEDLPYLSCLDIASPRTLSDP